MFLWAYDMAVSVNKNLAASYILEDPLGRIANDGRVSNLGRVGKKGYVDSRFAVNFDGIDDYGVLATRAINPDGDNSFEFFTPASLASFRAIITQSDTSTLSSREFTIYTGPTGLLVRFGGVETSVMTIAQGLKTSTRYGLTLNGTTAQVFKGGLSGALVSTASFTKGAAREPAAKTNICCITVNGVAGNFFAGLQYDIKINGTLWRMADRNQAIQPSTPAGNNMTLVNVTSDRWQEVPQ